jgi:uncharacterized membrane protein
MKTFSILTCAAAAMLAMIRATYAAAGATTTYVVTDLTPEGAVSAEIYGMANGQLVGRVTPSSDPHAHAFLWRSGGTAVDLHPPAIRDSGAWDASGDRQVGSSADHALLWAGSSGSVIDLNPPDFLSSGAYGISGNRQVGSGYSLVWTNEHALLWSGSADTAIDIHPSGFSRSTAYHISGNRIVGHASGDDWMDHAILWTGKPGHFVDLNPPGFWLTQAFGIAGKHQGGLGYGPATGGYQNHALLWAGTAESVVDLHPAGCVRSACWAISEKQQVGGIIVVAPNGEEEGHAAIWSGSATSFIDLHNLLPTNYENSSFATAVDANGVVAGSAYDNRTGQYHAIVWTPVRGHLVPEEKLEEFINPAASSSEVKP